MTINGLSDVFVEESVSFPIELYFSVFLFYFEIQVVVFLAHKIDVIQIFLNYKEQCRSLTRSIANEFGYDFGVVAFEKVGLKSGKCSSRSQIHFLSSLDSIIHMRIRILRIHKSISQFTRFHRRKFCSVYIYVRIDSRTHFDDFISYCLPFSITIQPQKQISRSFYMVLEILYNIQLVFGVNRKYRFFFQHVERVN